MLTITLVCSAHRDSGLCNAIELLNILRAVKPDAIFVEWRPSELDFYYKHGNVEAHAITKYREDMAFELVPVDRYDRHILAEIRECDRVLNWVEQTSQEYQRLGEERNHGVQKDGFRFLNSSSFERLTAKMVEIEEETTRRSGNQDLIRGLKRWHDAMQERDAAMIGNVYEYCGENAFDNGLLLVGAAHKAGIVKEIEKRAGTAADLIGWNFDCVGLIS